jgi:hypothetical protein
MKKLLAFFFLFLPFIAIAATVPATVKFYFSAADGNQFFNTREQACKNYADRAVSQSGLVLSYSISFNGGVVSGGGICNVIYSPYTGGANAVMKGGINVSQTCPSSAYSLGPVTSDPFARVCTIPSCPAGSTLNTTTNQCVDDCEQYKGKSAEANLNCGGSEPSKVCMPNNCAATASSYLTVRVGNCSYGSLSAIYTGSKCSGEVAASSLSNPSNANPPPANLPETDCVKQGMSYGTVNGAITCVPKGTEGAPPVKETNHTETSTKNTDSAGNTTEQQSSETKTITKDGDQVTTTTIQQKLDGTKTEETKTQPFDEFCAQNPNHKLCKSDSDKESKFNGDCLSNFVCEGDSIQCAMALKQHQTYCENTKENTYSNIFTAAKAETDALTQNGGTVLPSSTVNLPTTIQGQKLLTSGGISDMSFPLGGHSITLPLSKLSPALEFAGQIVLIISYLISAYILFGHKGAQ